MITLQRLVEQKEKKQKLDKIWGIITGIATAIFLITLIVSIAFNLKIGLVLSTICFAFAIVCFAICLVVNSQVGKVTHEIIRSIERILEHTLSKHFPEDSDIFIEFIKTTDYSLCFFITAFDEELSHEELAMVFQPVEQEINEIIHESLDIYYKVDKIE